MILPQHLMKIDLYGNPIAPMLSEYFNTNRVDNVHWYFFLKHYIDSTDGYTMPIGLFVPNRLGNMSQIIGFGLIALLCVKSMNIQSRKYFLSSFLLSIAILLWGQNVSRAFLEPLFLFYIGLSLTINFKYKYL